MSTMVAPTSISSGSIRIHENEKTNSFLHKLAALVAKLYTTFSQISQKDRHENVRFEQKYMKYTQFSANATSAQGSLALKTAVIAMAFFTISMGFSHTNDQIFTQKIAEQVPRIADLFNTKNASISKNYDAQASIQYQKLQDMAMKQQESSIKDSFTQVLNAQLQLLRAASASGG